MDKNRSEIFGQFCYDDSLTYEELIESEELLVANLESLLKEAGASHLDFTPSGDMLRFQCSMSEHDIGHYRDVAGKIAAVLPDGIRGRLVCLDKYLTPETAFFFFWIDKQGWQEARRAFPVDAPEGLTMWAPAK